MTFTFFSVAFYQVHTNALYSCQPMNINLMLDIYVIMNSG